MLINCCFLQLEIFLFFSLICQRQYWVKVSSGSCMFRARRDSIVCSQGPELTSICLLLLIAPLGRDCLHAHSIRVLLMYPYISVYLVLLQVLAALFCCFLLCFFIFSLQSAMISSALLFLSASEMVSPFTHSHDCLASTVLTLVCWNNGSFMSLLQLSYKQLDSGLLPHSSLVNALSLYCCIIVQITGLCWSAQL